MTPYDICPVCKGTTIPGLSNPCRCVYTGVTIGDRSGIQPEVMSKSVIKRLTVQKPDKLEDEKIREAFEEEHKISVCLVWDLKEEMYVSKPSWQNTDLAPMLNMKLKEYQSGYKSRQPEIEEWKDEFHRVDKEKDDLLLELSKRDQQIKNMRNHENCFHSPHDYKKEICARCGSDRYMDNWQQK